MTRLQVIHRTRYRYSAAVSRSYGRLCLLPRDTPRQRCLHATVEVDPRPIDRSERIDFFGNRVSYVQLGEAHESLEITARSEVDVVTAAPLPGSLDQSLGDAVAAVDRLAQIDAAAAAEVAVHRTASAKVAIDERVRSFAGPSFDHHRPVVDCLRDLSGRINREFTFSAAATDVSSTLDDLFSAGAGVCQDFAHLAVASLRSAGLPARYVSGYLETVPPPGEPKLVGVDASHAWASAYVPGAGWVDIDPTNDQFGDDRYVTVAWGRDYDDVAPVTGVIYSNSRATTLDVAVDVVRLGDP